MMYAPEYVVDGVGLNNHIVVPYGITQVRAGVWRDLWCLPTLSSGVYEFNSTLWLFEVNNVHV